MLIGNIVVKFGSKYYQQTTGIQLAELSDLLSNYKSMGVYERQCKLLARQYTLLVLPINIIFHFTYHVASLSLKTLYLVTTLMKTISARCKLKS
jgi:hypothetical protein